MSDNEQSSSSGSEEEEIDEEYHKARLQRIQRNKALLEGLGLNQPIAKALTPIKPSASSSVFDNDGTANTPNTEEKKKRKKAPASTERRSSKRISSNKRKTDFKEQETLSKEKLEAKMKELVKGRARGRITKEKFISQLHDILPKEIIVEKLANLQKISSNETLEYANQVLLPIVYYATYEDQEYLDQLCEKGSEKAIKNLVVIYNTATSKNYELNFSFLLGILTNITSKCYRTYILQAMDIFSVLDVSSVPLLDYLYLLKNLALNDIGKTNEWFFKKKNKKNVTNLLKNLLIRIGKEEEEQTKIELYSLFLESLAILSRDENSKEITVGAIQSSDNLFEIISKLKGDQLPTIILISLYIFTYIPLNEENVKDFVLIVKKRADQFSQAVEYLPWLDFKFIQNLLESENENDLILGAFAFKGCFDYLDVTYHDCKPLITSDKLKKHLTNNNLNYLYEELIEKCQQEEEGDDKDTNNE
ncbi:hypothetical protein ABK040_013232 [Willaertia magna]